MLKKSDITARCKKNLPAYLILLAISAVLVTLDQISKYIAVQNLPKDDPEPIKVIPYLFNFTFVRNEGAAWGILKDNRWIFIAVSGIAIAAIAAVLLYTARSRKFFVASLVLIFAGGIGNMIDRIANGYVVDFIQFAFWQSFPVFNVADSYVTIGGIMLLVYYIFIDKTLFADKKKKNDEENDKNNKTV